MQGTSNNSQPTQFDRGYKWLHWLMAFLFVLMLMAGLGFASAVTDAEKMTMLTGHSSIGALVSLLVVIRVTKRFVVRSPIPKHDLPKLQNAAAKAVQYALYVCMVLIPITGILTAQQHELPVNMFGSINISGASMGGYDESTFLTFRSIHALVINSFIILLVGHIGAALFHGFWLKDGVLRSMLPSRRKNKTKSSTVKSAS